VGAALPSQSAARTSQDDANPFGNCLQIGYDLLPFIRLCYASCG